MGEVFRPIVFFDGVCGLCNRSVDFVLQRDPGVFLFAPLQGLTSSENLDVSLRGENLGSIVLRDEAGTHIKSTAVLRICRRLPAPWSWVSVLRVVPRVIRDAVYDWVAANRYRWFGKTDTCRLPTPEERTRFLD